jgi:eukaryotic-like serine/threonine-protein kinase
MEPTPPQGAGAPDSNQPPASSPSTLVGKVISGRYRIEQVIGEGGMGTVYQAEHTLMRKRFAIKVLHPEMTRLPEVVARFEREAMAAAHIEHPNVASATDFGKLEDGAFFLVLEFVQGRSLREALDDGPLAALRAVHIGCQIASALVRAHSLGIVHRDLKPENVMLVERDGDPDFAKVLDFGIAKVPVGEIVKSGPSPSRQALTQLGMVYGTPEYMAPEQALGQEVDARADLYALGVMMYEMITGLRPFEAESAVTLLGMQVTQPPPSFQQRAPSVTVPDGIEAAVMELLEKEPSARPHDARQVFECLEQMRVQLRRGAAPAISLRNPSDLHEDVASARTAFNLAAPATLAEPRGRANAGITPVVQVTFANLGSAIMHATRGWRPLADRASPWLQRAREQLRRHAPAIDSQLAAFHARLPRPWADIPAVGWVVAVVASVMLVVMIGGLALCRSPVKAKSAFGSLGSVAVSASASAQPLVKLKATEQELKEAQAKGPEAVEALAKSYPADMQPLKLLARMAMAANNAPRAIEIYKQIIALEPKMVMDTEVGQNVVIATQIETSSDVAYAMLESGMGTKGLDLLYWMAYESKAQAKYVLRAAKILSKKDVRDRGSPALVIALELRAASSCEAKYGLLGRARSDGDQRALRLLQPLYNTRGCSGGFLGLQPRDCWPCMRRDNGQLLSSAISEIERRASAMGMGADGGSE